MFRIPSARLRKKSQTKLNLAPFADSILVFVLFILMSATFYHINDMGADIAVTSHEEKSLLVLKISSPELVLLANGSVLHRFKREPRTNEFSTPEIQQVLKEYENKESSITLEPENELTFEEIAKIMDIVRGQFKKIIFGNLS